MIIRRSPSDRLRPFLKFLWASDDPHSILHSDRERMIPTGSMHIVFRLSDHPIRIFESIDDDHGQDFRFGIVAGIRSRYYVKDLRPVRTVGGLLQPGVAFSLFRVTAQDLAEKHTALEDVWGQSANDLLERLHEANTLENRLNIFESFLENKVSTEVRVHPAVSYALNHVYPAYNIGQIVKGTGYSHKHFIQLFRAAVGLSPAAYSRIIRLQYAFTMLIKPELALIDVAMQAGFSDQAHFNREFREFAGITPGEYRSSQCKSHHVPIRVTIRR
jgi:AraC-like DNA-binding protein